MDPIPVLKIKDILLSRTLFKRRNLNYIFDLSNCSFNQKLLVIVKLAGLTSKKL